MLTLGVLAVPASRAATTNSTVSMTVASITWLSVDPADVGGVAGNCKSGTLNRTDLGTVMTNTKTVTSSDCAVVFGSNNNTAMLRAYWITRLELAAGRTSLMQTAALKASI
jgi:hypothetical protein